MGDFLKVGVTGFPGFIAENLVRTGFEESGEKISWVFFVLPNQRDRAHEMLDRIGVTQYQLINADMTEELMGIEPQDISTIENSIDVFYHLAAVYDLTISRDEARLVNVEGTEHVIDLLRKVKSLKKLNYVSSCFVAGKKSGLVAEEELDGKFGFNNFYEETKFEAEKVLRESQLPVPISIFRPAVVVGHSQTGETAKYDGPMILIRFLLQWEWLLRHTMAFPNLGIPDTWLNTIPVDIVSKTLWRAGMSQDHEDAGTFHVATPDIPDTFRFFPYILWNCLKLRNFFIPKQVSTFYIRILGIFPLPLLTGIPRETLQYFFYGARFSTTRFENLAHRHGISIPTYEMYYPKLIEFARHHRRPCPNQSLLSSYHHFILWNGIGEIGMAALGFFLWQSGTLLFACGAQVVAYVLLLSARPKSWVRLVSRVLKGFTILAWWQLSRIEHPSIVFLAILEGLLLGIQCLYEFRIKETSARYQT